MKNKKVQYIGLIILALLVVAAGIYYSIQRSQRLASLPNFVYILTDDLDFPLMPYMPNTNKLIGEQGATFTNYYVTSSACCPSRASMIRGQYPHNTDILENSPGFEQFYRNGEDDDTLALWLDKVGYKNSFIGKYLNLYPAGVKRSYITPGWSDWHVYLYNITPDIYFAYTLNENGKLVRYHKKDEDYSTDVFRDRALEFLEKNAKSRTPFFLYISTSAPHGPSTAAPRHDNLFQDLKYPQGPSFHEEDVSDKPQIVQKLGKTGGTFDTEDANSLFRQRVRSVQAVDEMVAAVVQQLEASGQLDNTYIIFTSDNGFRMGEHNLPSGKMLGYEEDIHVPFLIRGPGIPPNSTVTPMIANIDIAPTFAELAGAKAPEFVDGRSFVRFLDGTQNDTTDWRKAFAIETGYLDKTSNVISYRGVRTETFKYIEYENDELEFYDLKNDPYELNNLASSLGPKTLGILHSWLGELTTCKADTCRQIENSVPDINIKE
ncbi:MAG: sulfatase [Anaerolineales bacterium]|nr:sulfatase [Anaerolineales bacterium]